MASRTYCAIAHISGVEELSGWPKVNPPVPVVPPQTCSEIWYPAFAAPAIVSSIDCAPEVLPSATSYSPRSPVSTGQGLPDAGAGVVAAGGGLAVAVEAVPVPAGPLGRADLELVIDRRDRVGDVGRRWAPSPPAGPVRGSSGRPRCGRRGCRRRWRCRCGARVRLAVRRDPQEVVAVAVRAGGRVGEVVDLGRPGLRGRLVGRGQAGVAVVLARSTPRTSARRSPPPSWPGSTRCSPPSAPGGCRGRWRPGTRPVP